jgi:hypothetical protein
MSSNPHSADSAKKASSPPPSAKSYLPVERAMQLITEDEIPTRSCGASVAAGANCTISVTFTPTSQQVRAATLTVGYVIRCQLRQQTALGKNHLKSLLGFFMHLRELRLLTVLG